MIIETENVVASRSSVKCPKEQQFEKEKELEESSLDEELPF